MVKLELKPDFEEGDTRAPFNAKHGGCSKDGLLVWVYSDSLLEVYFADSDEIVATWRFGKILHDSHTRISCVTDFKYQGGHMLLVATCNLSEQGTLCLFNVSKKKVVRAVEFPQRITSMEVLFSNLRDDVPSWVISHHLNFFCGLVAVGTKGGYVYLTDLCLDELSVGQTSEIEPKKLAITGANLVDPRSKRDQARTHNKHLALLLDDQCHRDGEYYSRRQDDTIQKVFDEVDVHVTCLKYLSQAGSLAIGFNFGCFQMWRLHGPALDYSSRYKPECPAVSRFLLHEPENDPRKLLYLWIANDNSVTGEEVNSIATISLYQLCFAKKEFFPNFGLFYDDLETVYFWMDHVLSLDPYSSETRGIWSSHLINAYTISNPFFSPLPHKINDSFEEGLHSHDQSLSIFVWRVDSKQGGGTGSGGVSRYWMAIFDLNRWYHAQMPHSIRCVGTVPQLCPFWAVYRLDEVAACSSPPAILDVHVTGNNVVRFVSSSSLPPLEHSYPSALEMNGVKFITSQRIIRGHCYGWQQQLLHSLVQDGANYLIQPADFFHQCLRARLVPQYHDSEAGLSVDRKRHALLNLSLDYSLTPTLIHQCVELWADGDFDQTGCSLKFLLDWAWSCVVKIKEKLDSTCESLFDWSGQPVSSHTMWTLQHQHRSLTCLGQIFTVFLSITSPLTQTGELELELRLETIKLLVEHYEVLLWCLSQSLLPEVEEEEKGGGARKGWGAGLFAYPARELQDVYQKRRHEMSKLQGVVEGYPLLLIDGLVSCDSNQISTMWESRGGNGLYPPPSLQAAVYMFLLEDISLEVKQAVMLYLLQDLAAVCEGQSEALVTSFLQRFMVAPSLVHKVQGIWFLDHRDYEEGLRQLISPNACQHQQPWSAWVDVAVVNSLLSQGEARTATCFVHSGHALGETQDEQRLMVSVLVRNRNVSQAVEFMRRYFHTNEDPGSLMSHLLKECHEYKLIGELLQLHFRPSEELHIEKYMRERTEPNSLEPLFLYFLHSARYVQAFQLNEEMNRVDRMEASLASQERSSNRNRLMNAYLRVLPDITRKLIVEKQHKTAYMPVTRIRVSQPTPLSTVVHRQQTVQAASRASFVMALMDKVEEAMAVVEEALEEGPQLLGQAPDMNNQSDDRFLKTPLTPRSKSFASPPSKAADPSEISETRPPTNPLSAAKQRTLAGEDAETTAGYKSLHALTMECLSVLKTPSKSHHAHQNSNLPGVESAVTKTPQSILKVRRISRSSLSRDGSTAGSQWKRSSPHKHPKRLGFSQSDTTLSLSTPSPTSSAKPSRERTASASASAATTPKHLRFMGLSPTPSPSPAVASSSLELSRSPSEDSDEVWTDAMETSQDGQEVKGQQVVERLPGLGGDSVKDSGSVDEKASRISPRLSGHTDMEVTTHDNVGQQGANHTQQTEASGVIADLAVDTGSPDRYDDSLGKLVRPNLMSPWKHDVSSEDVCVDEEISFSLGHHRGKGEEPATLAVEHQHKEAGTLGGANTQKLSSYDQVKQSVEVSDDVSSQMRMDQSPKSFPDTRLAISSHEISVSQVIRRPTDDRPSPSQTLSHQNAKQTVHFESKSLSQTLSINTSSETISSTLYTTSTPEKRKRELDSPPATPPSSKMAKISELTRMKKIASSEREQKVSSFFSRHSVSPVTRKQESSEMLMHDKSKDNFEKPHQPELETGTLDSSSPEQLRLKTGGTGEENTKSVILSSVDVEGKLADIAKTEEFVSSDDFLRQLEKKTRAAPEVPASPSRRKSSRLNPTESVTDSSNDLEKPSLATGTNKQSVAVLNELASLVGSVKHKQGRQQRRSKTPERLAGQREEEEEHMHTSLRRSQRRSKTPERITTKKFVFEGIASKMPARASSTAVTKTNKGDNDDTTADISEGEALATRDLRGSRRQSKTPERRLRKAAQAEESKHVQQSSQEEDEREESGGHNLRRSRRHSKTPERMVKQNIRHADRSSASESAKESSDERDETQRNVEKSETFKVPETIGTKDDVIGQLSGQSEVTSHDLRYSRRLSKTPERVIKKSVPEEKTLESQKVEEVITETKRSTRQSKTPERTMKKLDVEEKAASPIHEEIIQESRHSTRQSKTPERAIKKLISREKVESMLEDATPIMTRSTRQSKTPERVALVQKVPQTNEADVSSHYLRQTRRQSKTPERTSRQTKAPELNLAQSVSEEVTTSSEVEEHNLRQSRRRSKTPERKRKITSSEDTSSDREEGKEMATPKVRRSTRHPRTPERLISSIEGAVRKSSRPQKSPEKLNTPEIESLSHVSHSPNRHPQQQRDQFSSESPTAPTSPAQLPKESANQTSATPTRKSRRPLKSPERLNTDQIEPVGKAVSPNRASIGEKKSPAMKPDPAESGSESTEDSKTATGRKASRKSKITANAGNKDSGRGGSKGRTEEGTEGEWREDMPPLRLDVEEEEEEEEGPEQLPASSPAFVFSPPAVHRGTRSHDEERAQGKKRPRVEDEEAAFMFSMPVSATTDKTANSTSDSYIAGAVGSSESGSVAESNDDSQEKTKRVTRKKKKLYQYSPKLLSPLTESETERLRKAKTRRESQRTSMNVTRRYSRGPGPLTRRVRPSSKS